MFICFYFLFKKMKKIIITNPQDCVNIKTFMKRNFKINHDVVSKLIRLNKIKLNLHNSESHFESSMGANQKIGIGYKLSMGNELIIYDKEILSSLDNNKNSLEKEKFKLENNKIYVKESENIYNLLKKNILHDNSDFMIFDKPSGLSCQGGSGLAFSLDEICQEYYYKLNESDTNTNVNYPKLVHRLDKSVSGLMVLGKTNSFVNTFSNSLKNEKIRVKKSYTCLTQGIPNFIIKLILLIKQSKLVKDNSNLLHNKSFLFQSLLNNLQFPFYIYSNEECSKYLIITKDFTLSSDTSEITPFGINYYLSNFLTNKPESKLIKNHFEDLTMVGELELKNLVLSGKNVFDYKNIEEILSIDLSKLINFQNTYDDYSVINYNLVSGKKHQIRKHLSKCLFTPILGDIKYIYNPDLSVSYEKIVGSSSLQLKFYQENLNSESLVDFYKRYKISSLKNSIALCSTQILIDENLCSENNKNSIVKSDTYDKKSLLLEKEKYILSKNDRFIYNLNSKTINEFDYIKYKKLKLPINIEQFLKDFRL
jgi:23S rRNA-/tRNA-specific pseudouridylate synthase